MATIKLRLSSKSDPSTKRHELLVRFFHGAVDQRAKTNIFVLPHYWDQENQRIRVPQKRLMDKDSKDLLNELNRQNKEIENIKDFIQRSFLEVGAGKVTVSKDWLKTIVHDYSFPKENGKTVGDDSFFDLFERFIDTRDIGGVTKTNYRVTKRALERFSIYSGCSITYDTLSSEMIERFVDFLNHEHELISRDENNQRVFTNAKYQKAFESVPESRDPLPRGKNTINGILKELRTFVRWGIKNGYTSNNPFDRYEIGSCVYGTPFYPTIEERDQLYNHKFKNRPQLAVQRDIFIFQCLIGCRVSDLKRLKKTSIIDGAVEYIARKTREGNPVTTKVPLTKTAIEIIERYKDIPGDRLLPFITDQKYNESIKEMCRIAGLNRTVTVLNPTTREEEKRPMWEVASSHMARRCFIGNLYKKYKDPNLIGSLSGHVEGSTAFTRYRDIDDEIKRELVDSLEG